MTNEEILIAIIKQSDKNGWEKDIILDGKVLDAKFISFPSGVVYLIYENGFTVRINIFSLIFNHDFLKAFFGIKGVCFISGRVIRFKENEPKYYPYGMIECWKYHLQKIALEKPEDRLKCFEQYLKD